MLLKLYKTVTVFQKLERLLGKKYFRRLNYGFHGDKMTYVVLIPSENV